MTPDVVAADPTCKLLSAEADTEKAPTATRPPNTIFFIMIEADTLQESLSNFFFVASVVKRAAGVASLDEQSTVLSAEVFSSCRSVGQNFVIALSREGCTIHADRADHAGSDESRSRMGRSMIHSTQL